MFDQPVVSVVVPTYQRSDYLADALHSILDQSYTAFEVVVVEDGRSGHAVSVIESLDDPRIRYHPQDHAGRSAARNLGMELARGRYLAFLDDDDLYLPDKLASQVAFLDQHKEVDLVGSGAQIIDETGSVQRLWRTWLLQPELALPACLYSCPLAPSTVMFRARVLQGLDHWFDTDMDLAEDTDFFVRILLAGFRMAWLPRILTAYRVHSGSSQGHGPRYADGRLRILDKVFARPDLPAELLDTKTRVYAKAHLASACHCYATLHLVEAGLHLERALVLEPGLAQGTLPDAVAYIAGFAGTFRVDEPMEYIDLVFRSLPESCRWLRAHRRTAVSAFYLQRLFDARRAAGRASVRDWLRGVANQPRWLGNRGVWSILLKSVVRWPSDASTSITSECPSCRE